MTHSLRDEPQADGPAFISRSLHRLASLPICTKPSSEQAFTSGTNGDVGLPLSANTAIIVGYLMNTHEIEAFREQVKALTKRLRDEQPQSKGISDTEIRVLTAAERAAEPLRPGQLAAGLKMTSTNMAIALRSLEQSGLIVREQDSVDKRQRFVHVTTAGRQLVEESRIERHAWLQSNIRRLLTREEQKLLARAGKLMQRLAEA